MNIFTLSARSAQKMLATMAVFALVFSPFANLSPVLAASTGISTNVSSLDLDVDEKGNVKVSTEVTDATATEGTYISVSDDGGGTFFGGNLQGGCSGSQNTEFDIEFNKAFCYSNSTPGTYTITVKLFDATDVQIGDAVEVDVTVTAVEEKKVNLCHATASETNPFQYLNVAEAAVIAGGHTEEAGDIIEPFGDFAGQNLDTYYEAYDMTGQEILDAKCPAVPETTVPDADGDSVPDAIDNCVNVVNEDQLDTDQDQVGDACEVPDPICEDDSAINYNEPGSCVYEDGRETITICKYDADSEDPIAGWGMTISNNQEGESNVTFDDVTTGENGCTSVAVYPEAGPFYVSEADAEDWTQVAVEAYGYGADVIEGNAGSYCSFFPRKDESEELAAVQITEDGYRCDFYNSEDDVPEPVTCIDPKQNLLVNGSFEEPIVGGNGSWAINAVVNGWSISLSDGLEIWHNLFGTASDGDQNAELDGNNATKITQAVPTIPGATYQLRFDFAPRPGTGLDQNNMDVFVNDAVFMNVAADGTSVPTLTSDVWTTYSDTFVAADVSTDIGFEDKGTADEPGGLGTLLDNAVLCLVSEPEPEPEVCELTLVSDVTNKVGENNAVLTYTHENWVDELIGSAAAWIWGTEFVANPTTQEVQTFTKTFTWNGPVSSAILDIATDNSYVVKVNGVTFGGDASEDNFTTPDQHDLTAFLQTNVINGTNTLEIEVTNLALEGGTAESNPAGLLYNLTIEGDDETDCATVPEEPEQCVVTENLLKNGSFESPVVEHEAGWDIFESVINGLEWAVSWLNPIEDAPVPMLELQRSPVFPAASEGVQYAELDSNYTHPGEVPFEGDARVMIAQTIETVPGEEYTLTFDFSAIPWGRGKKNNIVIVRADGSQIYTATESLPKGASETDWSSHSVKFTATDDETTISFEDGATTEPQMSNTVGTLVDNISLTTCLPDDDGGGDGEKTYEIFGFVWDDVDEDDEREEGEDNLEGWTVRAVNTETNEVRETTTDADGRYEFNVPAGTWKISEEAEEGWVQLSEADGDGTYTVTVPGAPLMTMAEEDSLLAVVMDFLVPTAHAVALEPVPVSYGAFNFGNDYEGSSNGGGRRSSRGSVAGDSTSAPEGAVLGEATSTMPVGAPNTGAGGTSHSAATLPTMFAILSASSTVRKSK